MSRFQKELLTIVLATLAIYSGVGIIVGGIDTAESRGRGADGCVYRSIAPYTNLGYLGACELFRARFNKEQPVKFVPSEQKELK